MLVRAPVAVVPAEVTADERQHLVDPVLRLVPTLRAGHLDPPLDLPPLGRDPRQAVVEQPRDPVLDGEIASAALAPEPDAVVLVPGA